MRLIKSLLFTAGCAAFGAFAQAPYPQKNVTLVTHSSPGGGSDVFLRALARHLGPKMGVNFAVENVRGGSGARAVSRVAQAPADGTVFYATTPTYIQTSMLSKVPHGYDSLMPVAIVFLDPEVIYTRAESPHKTLGEAMKQARANPGKARWGASNPASLERIAMERLNRLTQARAAIVSHEGGGDQMIGVLNGTYDIGIGEIQEVRAQLEANKIRLLAVLTDKRLPDFPQLATAQEQGIDLVVTKFRGLAGPKGLPADVLKAWSDGLQAVLADPAYRKEYARESLVPAFMDHQKAAPFTEKFAGELAASLRELGLLK
jgi:tripartite-type tricarboxylate transporter receptor subunit TctC